MVGPQYGTCFMSHFWHQKFEAAPKFLGNWLTSGCSYSELTKLLLLLLLLSSSSSSSSSFSSSFTSSSTSFLLLLLLILPVQLKTYGHSYWSEILQKSIKPPGVEVHQVNLVYLHTFCPKLLSPSSMNTMGTNMKFFKYYETVITVHV